jgi:hypothetical protein
MFVKKKDDDAGVSARTSDVTPVKWSSTPVRRWGTWDGDGGRNRRRYKRMIVQESAAGGEARTSLIKRSICASSSTCGLVFVSRRIKHQPRSYVSIIIINFFGRSPARIIVTPCVG